MNFPTLKKLFCYLEIKFHWESTLILKYSFLFCRKSHGDFDKEFVDSVNTSGYSYNYKNIITLIHESGV